MSVLDLVGRVLTKYQADVSDQIAGLEKVKASEVELSETQKAAAAAHNEGLQSMAIAVGALAAVIGVAKLAWDGYKEGIQEAKLEQAAAGVDMDRLSKAAGGLVDKLDLLTFAAKAHKSAWKNTQEDLEVAERAMRALEQRGMSAEDATNAVTNAVVGLKTKGLKALGVEIDDSKLKFDEFGNAIGTNAQKLEQHQEIMKSLGKIAHEVSDGQDGIGDSMKRTEVKLSDSWNELKKGLGELVVAMQPLLQALAMAVSFIADIVNDVTEGDSFGGSIETLKQRKRATKGGTAYGSYDSAMMRDGIYADQQDAKKLADMAKKQIKIMKILTNMAAGPEDINKDLEFKAPKDNSEELRKKAAEFASKVAKEVTDEFVKTMDAQMAAEAADASRLATSAMLRRATGLSGGNAGPVHYETGPDGTPRLVSDQLGGYGAGGPGMTGLQKADISNGLDKFYAPGGEQSKRNDDAYNQQVGAHNKTVVEKMFGPIDEIHATKEAMSALTESVSAGYKSMVEGSGSFGDAMKKTLANTLEAEGSKMQVLAIENTAYGLASLALGPIGGTSAAGYFGAAAMFEAGAIAAGIAARALGAGGGSTVSKPSGSGAAASTPSSVPANSNVPAAPSNTTIIYGDNFSSQSTRQRADGARKMLSLTQGPGTGKDQVVYA